MVIARQLVLRLLTVFGVALLLTLASAPDAFAVDAAQALDELDHAVYTTREGAPTGVVDLAQTPDGYLWLASESGLFSFDGNTFRAFHSQSGPQLNNDAVTSILSDKAGDLWVGFQFGGVGQIHDGHVTAYSANEGLPKHSVFGLLEDLQGTKWAATVAGLFRLTGGHWVEMKADDGTSLQVEGFRALQIDKSGNVWIAASKGVFCKRAGSNVFIYMRPHRQLAGITILPNGFVWFYDEVGTRSLYGPEFELRKHASWSWPAEKVKPEFVYFDSQGGAWGYDDKSVVRTTTAELLSKLHTTGVSTWPKVQHLDREQRLSGTNIQCFLEDREGNIWVCTDGGIDRFRSNKFNRETLNGQVISSAAIEAGSDNTLWIGTDNFGLLKRGIRIERTGILAGQGANYGVQSLGYSPDGQIWSGGRNALWRFGSHKSETVTLPPHGQYLNEVQAIATDDKGGVWISLAQRSVFYLADGEWTIKGGAEKLPDEPALSLYFDRMLGGLWLGYTDNELAFTAGKNGRRYSSKDGLNVGNILVFCADVKGLWVGGSEGVAYFDGHAFHELVDAQGQRIPGTSGIIRRRNGELWINGKQGVSRFKWDDLRTFLHDFSTRPPRKLFSLLDGVDGVPATLRPIPSAAMTADGRLWFSTARGLYSIDPNNIPTNKVSPYVDIIQVSASGKKIKAGAEINIPKNTSDIEFEYTSTSLSQPTNVQFRYKLDGLDKDWNEAGNRRQAFYTNLSPGTYTFHVIAANEDGVWNKHGASIVVVLPASFWQTWWFKFGCFLLVAIILWAIYLARLRMASEKMKLRMRDRAEERENIARDLHDTLLQDTQGLILNFQLVAQALPSARDRQRLDTVLDQADIVMAQARDRVSNLRDRSDGNSDLLAALTEVGAELASGGVATFNISSNGDLADLHQGAQKEVFLIGREALLNAFRHSKARAVEAALTRDKKSFSLTVRDDGVGLGTDVQREGSRPGHWGLIGMRERAAGLGGKLQVRSDSNGGTEIFLHVPASRAFIKPKGRFHIVEVMRAIMR